MAKPKKGLQSLKKLLKNSHFTATEAKNLGVSSALLAYYIKQGMLIRLARGVYRSIDFKGSNNFQWEDLVEALKLIPGSVVCLISALAIYEITEEIPRQHWIAVSHNTSIHRDDSIHIVRFRNMNLGRSKIELARGLEIPIFDRERTIIDSFRLLSRETAIKALKSALSKKKSERLDFKKLHSYSRKLRFNIEPYLLTVTT